MLRELDSQIWVTDQPLRFIGLEVGTRMTVVRLGNGTLWLHSPVEPVRALRDELDKLGPVRAIVAPNKFHHLHAGEWSAHYPSAKLFAAPGLPEKRPDLTVEAVLGDSPADLWDGDIAQHAFAGFPMLNEVLFFHPASRTLITSDLVFNLSERTPALTRRVFRLVGARTAPSTTLLERLGIRDRAAARRSIEHVLAWDFDRIVLAHGDLIERGGKAAIRDAYAWLLG